MTEERIDPNSLGEDEVLLTFYSKDSGEDAFDVVLHKDEYESFLRIAEQRSTPFEEVVLDAIDAYLQKENTQWVIPEIDENGALSVENGTVLNIPDEENSPLR